MGGIETDIVLVIQLNGARGLFPVAVIAGIGKIEARFGVVVESEKRANIFVGRVIFQFHYVRFSCEMLNEL